MSAIATTGIKAQVQIKTKAFTVGTLSKTPQCGVLSSLPGKRSLHTQYRSILNTSGWHRSGTGKVLMNPGQNPKWILNYFWYERDIYVLTSWLLAMIVLVRNVPVLLTMPFCTLKPSW